ncbi:MAG: fumarylacetoacetate hydrolase family protein [Bacteroidia bacterium]|nr:fumarylacetoacetate hydrolase family protein [Bacteroidia bacterium]
MKIYKTKKTAVIVHEGNYYLTSESWDSIVNRDKLYDYLLAETKKSTPSDIAINLIEKELLPPIGSQEVWAAGVTYFRSKEARMDESKDSGGASFYDKVYDADRPELFFKSTAERVVGHGGYVHIRKDSTWNVPEPELALFINSNGNIEGYTIGNDMSSRSIEGENMLYLPQAKTYSRSAALGPCLYVPASPIPSNTTIEMEIIRNGKVMYHDIVQISQMKRKHTELASWLFRELDFPSGCFLMTGTCLVPSNDFTLAVNDVVNMTIDGIGMLTNTIDVKKPT